MDDPIQEFNEAVNRLRTQIQALPSGEAKKLINQIAKQYNISPASVRHMIDIPEPREQVKQLLNRIPDDTVTTYGNIAKALKTGPQAVALILKASKENNPAWIPPQQASRVLHKANYNGDFMVLDSKFTSDDPTIKKRSDALKLTHVNWTPMPRGFILIQPAHVMTVEELKQLL